MNKAGVVPVVSNDERCCGHDLNWTGDEADFEKLMEHNVELVKRSGAKKVVFTCPECYRTFNMDYRDLVGDLPFETVHIADYIQELIESGALKVEGKAGKGVQVHLPRLLQARPSLRCLRQPQEARGGVLRETRSSRWRTRGTRPSAAASAGGRTATAASRGCRSSVSWKPRRSGPTGS